jgi:hypothetical protein
MWIFNMIFMAFPAKSANKSYYVLLCPTEVCWMASIQFQLWDPDLQRPEQQAQFM